VLAALASGCVLAPKGTTQERARVAEAGAPYATPAHERLTEDLPPDPQWRDLLRHAFLNNGGLEAAYFEWAAAAQRIDIAAGYPNTNVSVGFEYLFSGDNLTGWDRTTLTVGFDPMQNLSFPTKVMAAGRVAYENARAAGERFAAAKFALQRDVLEAWLEYALLAERIRLQAGEVELLRLASSTVAARVETGMRQQDLLGIEIERQRGEDELRTLEAALPQQRARLNALIGRAARAPLPPPAALPEPRPLPDDDAALLAMGADGSPELAALAHDVSGRADALDYARQQYFPDINPFVGLEGSIAQVVGAAVTIATMIPQIQAGIREASLNLRSSEALLRQTGHQRDAEFVAALLALRNAERQRAVLERIVPLAELAAGSAGQANAAGAADLSAVIDAERMLIDVRGAVAEARVMRERELAALEQLAGVDVERMTASLSREGEGRGEGDENDPSQTHRSRFPESLDHEVVSSPSPQPSPSREREQACGGES
jgi:outer membrane protein TolC